MVCRMRLAFVLVTLAAATAFTAPKKHEPSALVLVLDRSGSMKGEPLESMKQAAVASADALEPDDQIGIITVDHEADVLVPLQRAANRKDIAKTVSHLEAGGGTSIVPGVKRALDVLRESKFKIKHVILISGGESPEDRVAHLVKNIRDAHITGSTIGVRGAER